MAADARLDELLLRWEELHEQGQAPGAEELCRDCPELIAPLAERIRLLREMDDAFGTVPLEEPAGGTGPGAASESFLTRTSYRVLRFHAHGGLGEVLVARDEQLGREVALKRIQQTHSQAHASRVRFLREAEITGRLEHPGIVPVYGAGQDGRGRPCYVMRFIHGETLREAITRYHDGKDGLGFRQLVGRFVGVCNAIAYAHSQGVVHRDLKPANIMLGPYGETLVVDWGLAKEVKDREDGRVAETEGGAGEVGSVSGPATAEGQTLGTPAYMSPEQAAGRWDAVGPVSDVYSLGATLYTILTNRAPFEDRSVPQVLAKVQRGDFLPPRSWNSAISPALEAVCLKAMALRPENRYATALDLAADVEHWLGDEPVSAFPDPLSVRVGRWVRRHRTLVMSAAAAAVVAVVVLTVSTWLLARANRAEREAAEEARQQRARAEASFLQARETVDKYLAKVSQTQLLRSPGTQPLRRELLQMALDYYKEFLHQRSGDPSLREDVARTLGKIGQITGEIGSLDEALSWADRALSAWRELVAEQPDNSRYRRQLGEQLDGMGLLQRRTGRPDDALRSYQEAVEVLARVVREQPEDETAAEFLGRAHGNLGATLGLVGRYDESVQEIRRGLEVRERLLERRPKDRTLRLLNAHTYNNLGTNDIDRGRLDEALPLLQKARALYEQLVREEEAGPEGRKDQTIGAGAREAVPGTDFNIALLYLYRDEPGEALRWFTLARTAWERSLAENASSTVFRLRLVQADNQIGLAHLALGKKEEAERDFRQAHDRAEKLHADNPKDTDVVTETGISLDGLAEVRAESKAREEVLALLDQALAAHKQALAQAPKAVGYLGSLSSHYQTVGRINLRWGKPADAAMAWREAKATLPTDAVALLRIARGLAQCASMLGKDERERQQYADEAVETLREAIRAGLTGADRLRADKAFAPVRDRADFQALLAEMINTGARPPR